MSFPPPSPAVSRRSRRGAVAGTCAAVVSTAAVLAAAPPRGAPPSPAAAAPEVRLEPDEARHRIDVMVGGDLFTSYRHDPALKKPVLYPLRSDRGQAVTRGFPLDPRPGDSADHPHHVGLWLNYGDVNGVDFWNNSSARPAEEQTRMGTVRHARVVSAAGGVGRAVLEVEMDWLMPGGEAGLHERTRFVFHAREGARVVDRITSLEATKGRVAMTDNKEGLLGLRVARSLEHFSKRARTFLDGQGRATKVDPARAGEAGGRYLTSEGVEGEAVWGTRGRWALLTGRADGAEVTVAILDHPENPGFPTYWHARGYGLFAANPLGARVFTEGKDRLGFAVEPGRPARFRYRVVILSKRAGGEEIEVLSQEFARER